jgi:hypothetical protein
MVPNQPNPSRRSWKDAATPAGPSPGARQDWHHPDQPAPDRRRLSRNTLATLLLGGILVVGVALVAVLLWPSPPPPVRLVLVAAGYETNLAVPPNVAGRNGLRDLAAWGKEQSKRIEVREGTLVMGADPVAENLEGCKSATVVVFLAAHGGAAGSADREGPYLIRDDADLGSYSASRYRIAETLQALGRLPEKTHKLLLLDATQITAHWASGQLHNDFARSLEVMEKDIAAIPNLTVIASSRPYQRSWVAEEWHRTAFGHFILEGLRGLADQTEAGGNGDGRVTALELFTYVEAKVDHWARQNRAAAQKPFLLGGRDRAQECELVAVAAKTIQEEPVPSLPDDARFKEDFKEVEQVWSEVARLRQAVPSPAAYTPQLWKKYLDAALRHEQLIRAGDRESAVKLRLQTLGVLAERIARGRSLNPGAALSMSLSMPAAFGVHPSEKEANAFRDFDASFGQEFAGRLATLQGKADQEWRRPLMRLLATGAVLRKVEEDPKELTEAGRALAEIDGSPDAPRPAEAHFLAMLHPSAARNDPKPGPARVAFLLDKGPPELLSKALRVRHLAEEAAFGLGGALPKEATGEAVPAYSERVLPSIQETIGKADGARRKAEDLLFTDDEALWKKAGPLFDEAEKGYREAQQTASLRRWALHVRDMLVAELPFYTHWCAANRDLNDPNRRETEPDVALAWEAAHQLQSELEGPDNPVKLRDATSRAAAAMKKVRDLFTKTVTDLQPTIVQKTWHEIEAVLQVPFIDQATRLRLLRDSQTVSHDLNARGELRAVQGMEEAPRQARLDAQRQRRLALAFLGPEWAQKLRNDPSAGGVEDERDWPVALRYLGERVGEAIQQMPVRADSLTASALRRDPGNEEERRQAARDLRQAAWLARMMEGAAAETRLKADPVGEQRRLLLHNLLCWQAGRTFEDFWAALSPAAPNPYYRTAGLNLLREAETLLAEPSVPLKETEKARRLGLVRQLREKLNADLQPVVGRSQGGTFRAGSDELHLTDEKRVARAYEFRAPEGMPSGTPVLWIEKKGSGIVIPEELARRLPRRGFNQRDDFTLETKDDRSTTAEYSVHGLFRGHESVARTQVFFHRQADLALHDPPVDRSGKLAVQSSLGGTSRTAVDLVIDCSGSMKNLVAGGGSRFSILKGSLLKVMRDLPEGVLVSLRVFGGFGDVEKARTQALWSPRAWKGRESLEALRRELGRQEAQLAGGTPLVASVIEAARSDFPTQDPDDPRRSFEGLRTVVIVTDGVEDEFAANLKDNPAARGTAINKAIAQGLKDAGVAINVIGFEVGVLAEKDKPLQRGFEDGIKTLGGTYVTAGSADLEDTLKNATGKVRFQVEPDEWNPRIPVPGAVDISRYSNRDVENPHWARPLEAGDYLVRVRAGGTLRQKVRVNPGDSLLLDLIAHEGRLTFRRCIYSESMLVTKNRQLPTRALHVRGGDGRDWVLGVLQNEPRQGGVQMMTTLEKDEDFARTRDRLQQVRPRLAWFEVAAPDEAKGPVRLHVTSLPNYPAPGWSLDVPEWKRNDPVAISAWWWTQTTPLPVAGGVSKDLGDFKEIGDLADKVVPNVFRIEGEKPVPVTILSCGYEHRRVEVSPGKFEADRHCLVVRLRYPKGEPFFVLPPVEARGAWHRFYLDAGIYVGVFWEVTEEQAAALKALQFVSIADFKRKALGPGKAVSIGPPDEVYGRPAAN